MSDLSLKLKAEADFDPIELNLWYDGGFLRQILDIYPEVYRIKNYQDEQKPLETQWNTIMEFVSMTMLDPDVEEGSKYELYHNIEKLHEFLSNEDVPEAYAFGWWKQWRDDLNREVAFQN